MTNTDKGTYAEKRTGGWLKSLGFAVSYTPYGVPFDLLVNGWRCEVKHAEPNEHGEWRVNIHRHGKMTESAVDFYIFSLDKVPFSSQGIYLIKKAPLGVKVLIFTFRTLITKHASDVENVEPLRIVKEGSPLKVAGPNGLMAQLMSEAYECTEPNPAYVHD